MKPFYMILALLLALFINTKIYAQLPVKALANQSELLKSDNSQLAKNKKLVYDMWREFLEGGHVEFADKYFAENYMQHNPNVATGRKAVVDFFSKFMKPKEICDTIKTEVVNIMAEGNLVMICFVRTLPDPSDKSKNYTTTWFDMFRIEDNKIAEHWDCADKMK